MNYFVRVSLYIYIFTCSLLCSEFCFICRNNRLFFGFSFDTLFLRYPNNSRSISISVIVLPWVKRLIVYLSWIILSSLNWVKVSNYGRRLHAKEIEFSYDFLTPSSVIRTTLPKSRWTLGFLPPSVRRNVRLRLGQEGDLSTYLKIVFIVKFLLRCRTLMLETGSSLLVLVRLGYFLLCGDFFCLSMYFLVEFIVSFFFVVVVFRGLVGFSIEFWFRRYILLYIIDYDCFRSKEKFFSLILQSCLIY